MRIVTGGSKKKTKNLGLGVSLWSTRLTFTTEYYANQINGILLAVSIPASVSAINRLVVNAATFTNKGFEFSIV